MEECGVGYICNNDALQLYDSCLKSEKGKCHHQLNLFLYNGSVVMYIGNKGVYIRSWCNS